MCADPFDDYFAYFRLVWKPKNGDPIKFLPDTWSAVSSMWQSSPEDPSGGVKLDPFFNVDESLESLTNCITGAGCKFSPAMFNRTVRLSKYSSK